MPKGYDFAGWVTKNDTLCSDGVVIKQGAFAGETPNEVPLVWNHQHNDVTSVLGKVVLEHRDKGTYGYGYFNDTESALHAKQLVKEGTIKAMSIAANKIKRDGNNVVHGKIFEVSLVLTGANPGAKIEEFVAHSEYGEEMNFIIYKPAELIHSAEDEQEEDTVVDETKELTPEEIYDSLSPEQRALFDAVLEEDDDYEDDYEETEQPEEDMVRQSAFDSQSTPNEQVLTHSDLTPQLVASASTETGTLKDILKHNGIKNIEMLFPEAELAKKEPEPFRNNMLGTEKILGGVHKKPMTRFKHRFANMTEEQARARGYITGTQKLESVIDFFEREAAPQTVYVKQSIDRDYVIDIKDFDIILYLKRQLEQDLRDELARAILVGDGREKTDPMKIREDRIRPIIKEAPFYRIELTANTVNDLFAAAIKARKHYRGAGGYTAFIHPDLSTAIRLLRKADNTFWGGMAPMDDAQVARVLGAKDICETTLVPEKEVLMLNLSDYSIGLDKGGQVTNFEAFDIDFNKHKMLTETRLSGMIDAPKSIIHIKVTTTNEIAGVTDTNTNAIDTYNAEEQKVKDAAKERDAFEAGERKKVGKPQPVAGETHLG